MKITKGFIISSIIFLVIFLLVFLMISIPLGTIKKVGDRCEEGGWNGEIIGTGVSTQHLFKENHEMMVNCTKDKESEAVLGMIDALFFWEKTK